MDSEKGEYTRQPVLSKLPCSYIRKYCFLNQRYDTGYYLQLGCVRDFDVFFASTIPSCLNNRFEHRCQNERFGSFWVHNGVFVWKHITMGSEAVNHNMIRNVL